MRTRRSGDAGQRLVDVVVDATFDQVPQARHRVVDVDRARVERRDAEAHRVRHAEVRDDVGSLDQRPADRPGLGVVEGDVRPATGSVPRRADLKAQRGEPLIVQREVDPARARVT